MTTTDFITARWNNCIANQQPLPPPPYVIFENGAPYGNSAGSEVAYHHLDIACDLVNSFRSLTPESQWTLIDRRTGERIAVNEEEALEMMIEAHDQREQAEGWLVDAEREELVTAARAGRYSAWAPTV